MTLTHWATCLTPNEVQSSRSKGGTKNSTATICTGLQCYMLGNDSCSLDKLSDTERSSKVGRRTVLLLYYCLYYCTTTSTTIIHTWYSGRCYVGTSAIISPKIIIGEAHLWLSQENSPHQGPPCLLPLVTPLYPPFSREILLFSRQRGTRHRTRSRSCNISSPHYLKRPKINILYMLRKLWKREIFPTAHHYPQLHPRLSGLLHFHFLPTGVGTRSFH